MPKYKISKIKKINFAKNNNKTIKQYDIIEIRLG